MSYALVAVIPLLLLVGSYPLAGIGILAGIAGLGLGGRHAYRLLRCFYDCQSVTFDLLGKAQVTVRQMPTDEAN